MFRIRAILDDMTAANQGAIRQAQEILRSRFAGSPSTDIDSLPDRLRDPFAHGLRPILLVAEDASDRFKGCAVLLHAPDLAFCFLEFLAATLAGAGQGIGGALYERVREEARALNAVGLFFEALPDDPALSPDAETCRDNALRLRFYERFGARPIANTRYETPVRPGDHDPPYLCFDPLGRGDLPGRDQVRPMVRAILERKYGDRLPPAYVDMVVDSFQDDPIRLRPPRYVRRESRREVRATRTLARRIALTVNDRHDIHHVRERGYVEAPVRIASILREIDKTDLFERVEPRSFDDTPIRAVHDGALVDYLARICADIGPGKSVYPYVFPIRNAARPPKDLAIQAGYYCIDTFTPLNPNAYLAARRAVDCSLTAAELLLEGRPLAYALVRPPGHHAERSSFGGFCYFNNAAVAADHLSRYGRVALLDIDYHHGNGQQDIFYRRSDVLTVSIHGHPGFAYPYFSGFRDEKGLGAGAGYNLNIPLPETISPAQYREALSAALERIDRHAPRFIVLALGLDTAVGDPTGSWAHQPKDFQEIGRTVGAAGYPTLVVQEGGYRTRTLGTNARSFFEGLWEGHRTAPARSPRPAPPAEPGVVHRDEVRAGDVERVRMLMASAGVFSTGEAAEAAAAVEARLSAGQDSRYAFVFAEQTGQVVAFACFGPIPATEGRFALHWIVVRPDLQGDGIGGDLLARVEEGIVESGGTRIFAGLPARRDCERARDFLRRAGYAEAARLPDFHKDGEDRIVLAKSLTPASA